MRDKVPVVLVLFVLTAACGPALPTEQLSQPATAMPPAPKGACPASGCVRVNQVSTPGYPTPSLTAARPPENSPTLGPLITRTPSPPETCPERRDGVSIEPSNDLEVLESRILEFLNSGGAPDQLAVQLSTSYLVVEDHSADVTGDRVQDVVLEVSATRPGRGWVTAVAILVCHDAVFQSLAYQAPEIVVGTIKDDVALQGVLDMNGNGVRDIMYSRGFYDRYSATTFFVLEWDGQGFQQLVWTEERPGALMLALAYVGYQQGRGPTPQPEAMFPDTDGNGTREIVLAGGLPREDEPIPMGHARLRTDTWSWNGHAFTLRSSEFEPPIYRFQAARDGDAATLRGDYGKALDFYQQAVFDEELLGWNPEVMYVPEDEWYTTPLPIPEERPRLNAYGRYRILLVHAVQGTTDAVDVVYRSLKEKIQPGSAGYPYVSLADAFWEGLQTGGTVAAGCERARAYAAEHSEEVLVPLGSSMYGYFYDDYAPEDICPFE